MTRNNHILSLESSKILLLYIFYKNEPPVKYEIKSGKEVLSLEILGEQMTRMICCSFSKDGKNIYVGTKTHFILWNTSNGKLQKKMKEESSVKTMRNDWQLSIRDNLDAVIFSKFESYNADVKDLNAPKKSEKSIQN